MAEMKKLEIAKGAMVVTPPSYVFGEKGAKKQANITSWLHTAPEWCQPDRLGTLSFSAFLVVCDQDKKPHVSQQIL